MYIFLAANFFQTKEFNPLKCGENVYSYVGCILTKECVSYKNTYVQIGEWIFSGQCNFWTFVWDVCIICGKM
jgi:hypothetical protein